jgi:hypothetical protein
MSTENRSSSGKRHSYVFSPGRIPLVKGAVPLLPYSGRRHVV